MKFCPHVKPCCHSSPTPCPSHLPQLHLKVEFHPCVPRLVPRSWSARGVLLSLGTRFGFGSSHWAAAPAAAGVTEPATLRCCLGGERPPPGARSGFKLFREQNSVRTFHWSPGKLLLKYIYIALAAVIHF